MAIISTLGVSLRANTRRFTKSMTRALGVVKRITRSFMMLARAVAPLTLALTALGGLSFTALFQQTRLAADEVGKLSDELGIAVDKLLGLRMAAELTGTSVSVLTKGLQRMNRRIGEANAGYGEGVKGLSDLGLAAKDLAGLTAFEQFKKIADATAGLASQADKAAAVYTLFGRQGSLLLNMFALQGKGLDKVVKKFERLHGVVTRMDIRQVEAMNDEIVNLQTALKGFSLRALIQLAPTITAFITALSDGFVTLRKKHLPSLIQALERGVNKILDIASALAPAFVIGFQTGRTWIFAMADAWGLVFTTILNGIKMLAVAFNALFSALAGTANVFDIFDTGDVTDQVIVAASVIVRTLGSVQEMLGILNREASLIAAAFTSGFENPAMIGAIKEFFFSVLMIGVDTLGLIGKAFKNFVFTINDPDVTFMGMMNRDIEKWADRTTKLTDEVKAAFAEITSPVSEELAKLKAEKDSLISSIATGVVDDLLQARRVIADLRAQIEKIRNFKLNIDTPEIAIPQKDRDLLKRLLTPALLFGTQGAIKALMSNVIPAAPAPAAPAAPVIPPINFNVDPLGDLFNFFESVATKLVRDLAGLIPDVPKMPEMPETPRTPLPDWRWEPPAIKPVDVHHILPDVASASAAPDPPFLIYRFGSLDKFISDLGVSVSGLGDVIHALAPGGLRRTIEGTPGKRVDPIMGPLVVPTELWPTETPSFSEYFRNAFKSISEGIGSSAVPAPEPFVAPVMEDLEPLVPDFTVTGFVPTPEPIKPTVSFDVPDLKPTFAFDVPVPEPLEPFKPTFTFDVPVPEALAAPIMAPVEPVNHTFTFAGFVPAPESFAAPVIETPEPAPPASDKSSKEADVAAVKSTELLRMILVAVQDSPDFNLNLETLSI